MSNNEEDQDMDNKTKNNSGNTIMNILDENYLINLNDGQNDNETSNKDENNNSTNLNDNNDNNKISINKGKPILEPGVELDTPIPKHVVELERFSCDGTFFFRILD